MNKIYVVLSVLLLVIITAEVSYFVIPNFKSNNNYAVNTKTSVECDDIKNTITQRLDYNTKFLTKYTADVKYMGEIDQISYQPNSEKWVLELHLNVKTRSGNIEKLISHYSKEDIEKLKFVIEKNNKFEPIAIEQLKINDFITIQETIDLLKDKKYNIVKGTVIKK